MKQLEFYFGPIFLDKRHEGVPELIPCKIKHGYRHSRDYCVVELLGPCWAMLIGEQLEVRYSELRYGNEKKQPDKSRS
jgi:hypothetical protein